MSSYVADAVRAKVQRERALADLERVFGGRVLGTSALEHVATGRVVCARALVWAVVEQNNVSAHLR